MMILFAGIAELLLVAILAVVVVLILGQWYTSHWLWIGAGILVVFMCLSPRVRYVIGLVLFIVIPDILQGLAVAILLVLSPLRLVLLLSKPLGWLGRQIAYGWNAMADYLDDAKQGICPIVEVDISYRQESPRPEPEPEPESEPPEPVEEEEEDEEDEVEEAGEESSMAVPEGDFQRLADDRPSEGGLAGRVVPPILVLLIGEPCPEGGASPCYLEKIGDELYRRAAKLIELQQFGQEAFTDSSQLELVLEWDPKFRQDLMDTLTALWVLPEPAVANHCLVENIIGMFRNFRKLGPPMIFDNTPKVGESFLDRLFNLVARVDERMMPEQPKPRADDAT